MTGGVVIKPPSLARPDFEAWSLEKLVDFALYGGPGLTPAEVQALRTREQIIQRIVTVGPPHWRDPR